MGEMTLAGYAAILAGAIALLIYGWIKSLKFILTLGVAIVIALVGAWFFGMMGLLLGLVALVLLKR